MLWGGLYVCLCACFTAGGLLPLCMSEVWFPPNLLLLPQWYLWIANHLLCVIIYQTYIRTSSFNLCLRMSVWYCWRYFVPCLIAKTNLYYLWCFQIEVTAMWFCWNIFASTFLFIYFFLHRKMVNTGTIRCGWPCIEAPLCAWPFHDFLILNFPSFIFHSVPLPDWYTMP